MTLFMIVRALWHLNVYGAITARVLFDVAEFESFWYSTVHSYQKLITTSLSVLVPFSAIYLCEYGLSSLLHLKTSIETI